MPLNRNINRVNFGGVSAGTGTGSSAGVKKTPAEKEKEALDAAYNDQKKGVSDALDNYLTENEATKKNAQDLINSGYDKTKELLEKNYVTGKDTADANYAAQSGNLLEMYNRNEKLLADSRRQAENAANVDLQRTLKYLPMMNRQRGLSGTALSEASIIDANNRHASQLGTIAGEYQKNKVSLDNAYGTNKTSLDTAYNTDSANRDISHNQQLSDMEMTRTGKLSDLETHYGDRNTDRKYDTETGLAQSELDRYRNEAAIDEKYRQEEREDAKLAEAYAREDKAAFGNTLSSSLEDYIAEYSQAGDGKMSRAEFETLKSRAMQYYDTLDDAGKLAVDSALSRAEKLIRTDAQQAAYERSEAESVGIKDAEAKREVAVMDSVTSDGGIRLGYKREDGSIGDMSEATSDRTKSYGYHTNFTVTVGGEKYRVEEGNALSESDNAQMTSEYNNVYGTSPKAGSLAVKDGKILAYLTDNNGYGKWVKIQNRELGLNTDEWRKLCEVLGVEPYKPGSPYEGNPGSQYKGYDENPYDGYDESRPYQ